MISSAARRTLLALQMAAESTPLYTMRVPLTLASRGNARGFSLAHAEEYKAHRDAGLLATKRIARNFRRIRNNLIIVIRIVREAPRELDDDNLATACKSFRDGVADAFGVDDRDASIVFLTDQEKAKEASVLVEVYAMPASTEDVSGFVCCGGLE